MVAQFSDLKNNFFQHMAYDISKFAQNGHKSYNEYQWLLSLPLYRFIVLPTCTRCKSREPEHFTISKDCPYKVADDKIPIDRDEYYGLINFS